MNPWNAFVKRHKGSGLSIKELSAKYQREKGNHLRADLGELDAQVAKMERMAMRARQSARNDEVDELRRRLKQCEQKLEAKKPAKTRISSSRYTTWSSKTK